MQTPNKHGAIQVPRATRLASSSALIDSVAGCCRGNMDCLQKVVAAEGPAGLYKGNLATMLREGPAFAIWFTVYHRCCICGAASVR